MAKTNRFRVAPLGNTDAFTPCPQHPVRVRARSMPGDTHFEPHRHPWAQLAYCATGTVQVEIHATPGVSQTTYIIPPSRAVWIAPEALHAVNILEDAELRTLYIDPSVVPQDWQTCRVLVVSALLRELIAALDQLEPPGLEQAPPQQPTRTSGISARERGLVELTLDEIQRADTQALGVPLPNARTGDKRLRALCEAVLRAPGDRSTLAEWATDIGASERTVARLFRDELGMSYQQWRQQAILAHALPLLARGLPVAQVAAASGYASDSAFSAMFKAAMGQPPSQFQGR